MLELHCVKLKQLDMFERRVFAKLITDGGQGYLKNFKYVQYLLYITV